MIPNPTYFPPTDGSTTWETQSMSSLGWNESAVQPLKEYLTEKHTKSFMILVDGKIVMEEYFNGHTAATTWPWNSAGKILVTAATGIAQQEGLLDINTCATQYLFSFPRINNIFALKWRNSSLMEEHLLCK